jgi:DNA-binding Lrp family transcriptional regulator
VSRGLGPTQIRTLAILEDEAPLTIRELATRLGCGERNARRVVTSLDERGGFVLVRDEEGQALYDDHGNLIAARRHCRRIWLRSQLTSWLNEKYARDAQMARLRELAHHLDTDGICPTCGQAKPRRRRPVAK